MQMRLRFSDCVFDLGARQVVRRGKALPLSPKAFLLLELLIQKRPHAVSKQALQEQIWPDTFVVEANLANLVADLRAALGDAVKGQRIIRTVQRFGYSFAAPASAADASTPAAFRLVWDDREVPLREGVNILGRGGDSIACFDVYSVSRHHARITVAGDTATLDDLESKNGTFVRGERVTSTVVLEDGDEIRLGTASLTLRCGRPDASTGTVRSA